MYSRRTWYEYKESGYQKMKKDPVRQARKAMFAILNEYKRRAKTDHFPLQAKYALCFPDCKKLIGELPTDIIPESIFLHDDLYNLEARLKQLFTASPFPSHPLPQCKGKELLGSSRHGSLYLYPCQTINYVATIPGGDGGHCLAVSTGRS